MQEDRLRALLANVASGDISADIALEELRKLPFENLGFACIDQHRQLRQGLAEIIFCPGKTAAQIIEIAQRLKSKHDLIVATRASAEQAAEITTESADSRYFAEASTIIWGELPPANEALGKVAIITAGTADLPVAREAELILKSCAISSELIADIGVAGLHRVISCLPQLKEAKVCIVMAGMDGVLASVVGGLVDCPVIACPTSVGYGASFNGLSALLTMLNSCAAGITVVNIDNGFGAAIAAFRILYRRKDCNKDQND